MTGVAVRAADLVVRYGTRVALDRSTFTIPAGRLTALVGPNGSGKSTLLGAISGLVAPHSGEIVVERIGHAERRIAYVLQTTHVARSLPISVREVVAMGRYSTLGAFRRPARDDRTAVRDAMDRTGITEIGDRHLHELSGGQRQRVFVAQGLAQEHDLLLLDEPITGLDLPAAKAIHGVLHDEMDRGCTIVLTTHDLTEARAADWVLLLSGRVVAAGPPDEVLTAANLTEAYRRSLIHDEREPFFIDDPAHAADPERNGPSHAED